MGKRLCLGCMRSISPGEQVCPVCGYRHGTDDGNLMSLRPGTILNNIYLVGKMIGQGGFGITYVGYDLMLEMKVAIKEYFPMGEANRDRRTTVVWSQSTGKNTRQLGINNFVKEAQKMAKLEQIPSVVGVKGVFFQNDTSYIVMDFIEGRTLKDILKQNGTMSFAQCVSLLTPVMRAMERVNQKGIIHRDISPDNIMVDTQGRVHLLDLGAAKDISIQQSDGSVSSQLVAKHGFSPLEQYMQHSNIGSWTDVYAMSATIYFCVTGRMPPQAADRAFLDQAPDPLVLLPPLTQAQYAVILHGMAVQSKNRIQTMGQLLEELTAATHPSLSPKPKLSPAPVSPKQPKPQQPKKNRTAPALIAAAAVLIALCTIFYAWQTQSSSTLQAMLQSVTAPVKSTEPALPATKAAAPRPVAMTHKEFMAAQLDSAVCIDTYVQGHQSWWDGKIVVYAQSKDGGYFLYNMACSKEDAEKLVPGTRILVDGIKSEWAGEVEIIDASFEFLEGTFIAQARDMTDLLGTNDLIAHQNEKVAFKRLTVASVSYKNGKPGDDIYLSFTKGNLTIEACVESYLTGPDSDVYTAVRALNVGDVVDIEGFLYWYNGANTHITAVFPSY